MRFALGLRNFHSKETSMPFAKRQAFWILPVLLAAFLLLPPCSFGQVPKKPLTLDEVMKFRALQEPVLSVDGAWVAFTAQPDRGDGEVQVKSVAGGRSFLIERGSRPVFSRDGHWLTALIKPKAADMDKPAKDRPKSALALLDLQSGKIQTIEKVERSFFSEDGAWVAYAPFKDEEKSPVPAAKDAAKDVPKETGETGNPLVLRDLASGQEVRLENAAASSFDPLTTVLVYAVAVTDGKANGLFFRDLRKDGWPESPLQTGERMTFAGLAWAKDTSKLAFLSAVKKDKDDSGLSSLFIWDGAKRVLTAAVVESSVPPAWTIPLKNGLTWSSDAKRVFLGLKLRSASPSPAPAPTAAKPSTDDIFDFGKILEKRELDVWHWNDPLINSQQKKLWPQVKDRTFMSVFHVDTKKLVPLADLDMAQALPPDNPTTALGLADKPYQKEITWDGSFSDVYLVDLATGARRPIITHLSDRPSLSPNGKFVAFFRDRHWHLYEAKAGTTRNLTGDVKSAFFQEDDDRPADKPSYGLAGWMEDDAAVLLYDRTDLWLFPTAPNGVPLNLTAGEGRKSDRTFRVLRLDPDQKGFLKGQSILLSSYHNRDKNWGFYAAKIGTPGVERRLEDRKKFVFLAKAKKADMILFTREDYTEFPDLWADDARLASPRKLTDLNPQIAEFAWGSAELVEWSSADGVPLQGVLIKPGLYDPGKRYPVLVYYYELSSQRLYEFNQIVVNHRPCFPVWAGAGYAVFLPDVRFEPGRPGPSAVKSLVPGVQKLIDMGIADPKGIGLHGHSWSGYETAFVITQTDIFAAAIAGAPVGNMTSAYSGISWESGLARQFQYEKDQSRIGASLWEARDLYIENSPVFYADRIKTPLLLMHGDEDGAVPWYQSIEIYLALRRLGKDCIFLQYRGEPHHPQKYPNKLDYSIRMLEYFDHFLKGAPAADWIRNGVPYNGK